MKNPKHGFEHVSQNTTNITMDADGQLNWC